MSLQQRMIKSTIWNLFTNMFGLIILFIRFTLLSRWIPKETFGNYATAVLIILFTIGFASWGIGGGFLNRVPETEDETRSANVQFTLRLIFTTIWVCCLTLFSFYFEGETQIALQCLTAVFAGLEILQVPRLILIRRVVHRRLAILDLFNNFLGTTVALSLAWIGQTIWALLSVEIVTLFTTFFMFCVWKPFWIPNMVWDTQIVKYYLQYGKHSFFSGFLLRIIDKIDDFWVRIFLGNIALADYSRAYTLATYPRLLISKAVDEIALGSYAELKNNRLRLAEAFVKTNSLLIRTNLLLSGTLFIIAPELIRFLLTDKWVSIIVIFRLMLLFSILDPIKLTVGLIFDAIGQPNRTLWARLIQVGVLVSTMFIFGSAWGTLGVAFSMNLMILAGLIYLFYYAKFEINFSVLQLFLNPFLAFTLSILLTYLGEFFLKNQSLFFVMFSKACIYSFVYLITLLFIEKDIVVEFANLVKKGRQK